MDPNFSWIYLVFFLLIPLARIIPRFLAKRKIKNSNSQISQRQTSASDQYVKEASGFARPDTKKLQVLGEINRGAKTFEKIQKNTGLDTRELDAILQSLEGDGMLRVEKKQGFLGLKIELYATDKGFKEYYS